MVSLFTDAIVNRGHPSGAANQASVLRGEGVVVSTGNLGELLVDFQEYGWFPRQLPSEAAAGLTPFIDSDEE
jgi:methylated-DNA-protein-cysteine methyltransferase-like protein